MGRIKEKTLLFYHTFSNSERSQSIFSKYSCIYFVYRKIDIWSHETKRNQVKKSCKLEARRAYWIWGRGVSLVSRLHSYPVSFYYSSHINQSIGARSQPFRAFQSIECLQLHLFRDEYYKSVFALNCVRKNKKKEIHIHFLSTLVSKSPPPMRMKEKRQAKVKQCK